jgi:uncharacterized protein YdaU (DUF1376 family)
MKYFPHDIDSSGDPKLQHLHYEMGCEGTGIYWRLVEQLYRENGYLPINRIPVLARTLRISPSKLTKVLNGFDLFQKDDERFWSKALNKRLAHIIDKCNKAKENAKSGWAKRYADAEQTHSGRKADAKHPLCKGNANIINDTIINNKEATTAEIFSLDDLQTEKAENPKPESPTLSGKKKKSKFTLTQEQIDLGWKTWGRELATLRSIPDYPFDENVDIDHLNELSKKFPQINFYELIFELKAWLRDKPLEEKSHPRGRLLNWCKRRVKGWPVKEPIVSPDGKTHREGEMRKTMENGKLKVEIWEGSQWQSVTIAD